MPPVVSLVRVWVVPLPALAAVGVLADSRVLRGPVGGVTIGEATELEITMSNRIALLRVDAAV
jgi:hypothetical protein